MPAPTKPKKSEQELISDERAAEKAVLAVEDRLRTAEASGDQTQIEELQVQLLEARADSLHVRAKMQAGLNQWRKVKAWDAATREARELGRPLPE